MEIAALEGFGGGLGIFEITLHHRIAPDHDFALSSTVHWCLCDIGICNGDMLHHRHCHPLSRLDCGAGCRINRVPVFGFPDTFGYMAIGFSQPVYLRDVKAQLFDFGQGRRGRGRTGGKDLDRMIERAALSLCCIDQHIQHNRRTPEMGHTFVSNRIIDIGRGNVATTDQGAADQGHHPRMVPAIAMKQRYDLHEHRVQHHAP